MTVTHGRVVWRSLSTTSEPALLKLCGTPEQGLAVPHDLDKVLLVNSLLGSLKQTEELIWYNTEVKGNQYTSMLEQEVSRALEDLGQWGSAID